MNRRTFEQPNYEVGQSAYAHHDGIASSLRRLSQRSRRNADLTTALPLLDEFHDALQRDLEELLPDLEKRV